MSEADTERRFVVAATPRTGSSLLCEGLEATRICGRPAEFFAPEFRSFWCRHWSLPEDASFPHFLMAAIRHGTTDNGVYGFKIQQMHVADLAREALFVGEYFQGNDDDVLEFLFPRAQYINVVRRDRRAQAISFYRALATNEWLQRPTEEEQKLDFQLPRGIVGPPSFDSEAIRACEYQLAEQQEAWQCYFRKHGIDPLVVEYEKLDGDYNGQIALALDFLRLDGAVARTLPAPRLVRQADELSHRWRQLLEAPSKPLSRHHDVAP
jgi:LPS sulfotransferase NodH